MGRRELEMDEDPPGAPEWIVTFTDMISLLVTFFVLLMTFSSLDTRELLKVDAWLEGKKGVLKREDRNLAEAPPVDIIAATDLQRGARQPHARPQEALLDNIEEMGQRLTEDHVEVDLSEAADGLVVEFGTEACFAPGSAEPTPELARSLQELGRVLEHYSYRVVVEGTTDSAFQPTPRWPTAEALSFERARRAAGLLLGGSRLSPEIVQVAGLGTAAPRGDEDTPEGRRLDRRVRVRILSLSRTLAEMLEAQKERPRGAGDGR